MKKETLRKIKANAPRIRRDDFYHSLLKTSWGYVILYYALYFLSLNFFFAVLFYIVPNSLSVSSPSLLQCFFFSVQTFSTVGYGTIAPITNYSNFVVSIEIVIGLISMAVTTGLIFAKFSRPIAKILFTENLLITTFNNEKVLLFRCANGRNNKIFAAHVELFLLYAEVTNQGQSFTRFIPMKLQKDYSPVFGLSWTIMHTIDESSPLYNKSLEDMMKKDYEFLVLFNGTDDTYSTGIHQSTIYNPQKIKFNKYFEDILKSDDNGNYYIEYKDFNKLKDE